MARLLSHIPTILRTTAERLRASDDYQWGHMGLCNCGFLCQQVTQLTKAEIHQRAMQRYGDWSEQLNDYCPTSGLPFDDAISALLHAGFDIDDLKHLERLSDPEILAYVNPKRRLSHNIKGDVICYLNTWADLMEEKLVQRIALPTVTEQIPEPAVT
ncbi:MAG TPA: hypothetical protein VKZ68_01555 [Ohtaekwangia sp.]|nr:hypothetical protein [Ohtaekwangia sp.]